MAKILFGALMVDARGKMGGSVFSRNSSGAYMRNKVTPVNPQSQAQQLARSTFGDLAQQWNGLTEEQRQAWIEMTAHYTTTDVFGNTQTPSGRSLFIRLNRNLQVAGLPEIEDPLLPEGLPPFTLRSLAASYTLGTFDVLQIDMDDTVPASGMVYEATPPQPAGKYFVKSEYRIIRPEAAPDGSSQDLLDAYLAVFGAPQVGGKIFVRVSRVNASTGQRSTRQELSTIVVEE